MCGIAGIISTDPGQRLAADMRAERRWASAMRAIAPRGPDGHGEFRCASGYARLGHARLAVQDVSDAAAQPMTSEDGRFTLVYNGEIVNATELRTRLEIRGHRFRTRSDTEVLLRACEEWGARAVPPMLHGMYAFALWDARERTLLLATDHLSIKPLYWSRDNGHLYFGSTADAVRELLPGGAEVDGDALAAMLSLGAIPAPMTAWRGIEKFEPGRAMLWRVGVGPVRWRHWSPSEEIDPSQRATADDFARVFEPVCHEWMLSSDVPVSLLLSGGLDSSATAAALAAMGERPTAVTLGLSEPDDESPIASETARQLGLAHHVERLSARDAVAMLHQAAATFDEPQCYGALLTMTRVAATARGVGKVVISGDGGDEAFGGYSWHTREPTIGRPDIGAAMLMGDLSAPPASRAAALRDLASRSFVHAHLQAVFPRFHPREATALLAPLGARFDEDRYAQWLLAEDRPGLPWPRRGQRLDLMGFCAASILPKLDRATMAVGLELRPPFLDRRVLEWSLRLPVETGEDGLGGQKPAVRRYLERAGLGALLRRPKQGFSLRLGDDNLWTRALDTTRDAALFAGGALAPGWRNVVAPGVPSREARSFALCFLAAWYEAHAVRRAADATPALRSAA
ncbi:MAG TPA: asparagine synthase (glutamine-hydrolyzing) [Phycisphaerales bacterium]|nr:asparagine synthase (glutamine-hydrolyzing) [Phycisphaerales bacterium]